MTELTESIGKLEARLIDAVHQDEVFSEAGTIYSPQARTLYQFGAPLITFDQHKHVQKLHLQAFAAQPSATIASRLRTFGINARIHRGRAMLNGEILEREEVTA